MIARIRSTLAIAAAATIAFATASAVAASGTTEPGGDAAPGCAEITAALDTIEAFGMAFVLGDVETMTAVLPVVPEVAQSAVDAAPDDISETVETWVAPFPRIALALAEIDLSDPDAFEQAVAAIDTRASDTARGEVEAWAEFNCGWTSSLDVEVVQAPEPEDCEVLDAVAAAEAAGSTVDVDDLDGSSDVNLPGFWTKSCSYGNGAMSLSTMSFNSIEDAERFYSTNLGAVDGVVLDVDLGSLPGSSLAIQTGVGGAAGSSEPTERDARVTIEAAAPATPTVQVAVFEAPIPFSVTFTGDDVDPAAVVAAAEAVFASVGDAAVADAALPTSVTEVATTA
jgi:hypothetical protein